MHQIRGDAVKQGLPTGGRTRAPVSEVQDTGVALLYHFLDIGIAGHAPAQVRRQRPAVLGKECLEALRLDRFTIGLKEFGYRVAEGAHGQSSLRSEEHTSELQSLMRISYAVFCLKKKN